MVIIEDTREQKPLSFKQKYIDYVMYSKLEYGDYACAVGDIMLPVYFDRKGMGDLFGTLGKNYDRFKREINRCASDGNRLVIAIEGTLTDVLKGHSHSKMKGIAVARTLFTLMVKHNVPFVCCASRKEMSTYIAEYFRSFTNNVVNKEEG